MRAGTRGKADLYGGVDPRDAPAYGLPEAARYLSLPPTTLHTWAVGQSYSTRSGQARRVQPVLRVPRERRGQAVMLSFWNLVEAYVLATIRRHHHVSLQKVRKALLFVESELGLARPLIEEEFLTDGVDLFVDKYGGLINASREGQVAIRELLAASLKRIVRDPKGLADRLFPWVRSPGEPRLVEIDQRRAFGRLVVSGTGIPTEVLAQRFRADESIADLCRDYGLSAGEVEAALRWELSGQVH